MNDWRVVVAVVVAYLLVNLAVAPADLRVAFPNGDQDALRTSSKSYRFEIEPILRRYTFLASFRLKARHG